MRHDEEALLARLRVPGRADSLRLIRALVREVALGLGPAPEWALDLVLAVDEACQNVVRHGYRDGAVNGDIVVEVTGDAQGLTVQIRDTAPPVDPARLRPRALDEVRPGGLGVHLMRTLTDDCRWQPPLPGEAGNTVVLRKLFGHDDDTPDEPETRVKP